MNSAEADLHFPVLCLTNRLQMHAAKTLVELTTWRNDALQERESELGMEIVDAGGRCFSVRAILPVLTHRSWLRAALDKILFRLEKCRVEYDLVAKSSMSLEQLKLRVLACVEDDPESYCYDPDHCPFSVPMPLDEVRAFIDDSETIEALILDGLDGPGWIPSTEQYTRFNAPHQTYQDTVIKAQSRQKWVDQEELDSVAHYKAQAAQRIVGQRLARAKQRLARDASPKSS